MFACGNTVILVPADSNVRSTLRNCKPDTTQDAIKVKSSVLVQSTVTLCSLLGTLVNVCPESPEMH